MIGFSEIVGGLAAVFAAAAPAIIALGKIKELHVAINSQLSAMIAATKLQAEERIAATVKQAEERILATKLQADMHSDELNRNLEAVKQRNDQLLDQLAEAMRRLPLVATTEEHH